MLVVCTHSSLAQELASSHTNPLLNTDPMVKNAPRQGQTISLDKFLTDLETLYKIRFAYENKVIEDKFLSSEKVKDLMQSDDASDGSCCNL